MGFIRRLLGRDETAAEPTKSRQQAGLAEAIDKRRAGTEAVVVRLMPDLAVGDVRFKGKEDICPQEDSQRGSKEFLTSTSERTGILSAAIEVHRNGR